MSAFIDEWIWRKKPERRVTTPQMCLVIIKWKWQWMLSVTLMALFNTGIGLYLTQLQGWMTDAVTTYNKESAYRVMKIWLVCHSAMSLVTLVKSLVEQRLGAFLGIHTRLRVLRMILAH